MTADEDCRAVYFDITNCERQLSHIRIGVAAIVADRRATSVFAIVAALLEQAFFHRRSLSGRGGASENRAPRS